MEKTRININKKSVVDFMSNNAITLILVVLVIGVGFYKDNFISWDNFKNISVNTAVRFVIALGVSGCLITRGTDLSAGRIVGLGACIAATLVQKSDYSGKFFPNLGNVPLPLIFIIAITVCALVGLVNGTVISFFKVPPFIATLGMQTLVYGCCLVYTGAQPLGQFRDSFNKIASGSISGIPYLFLIAFILGLIMWFLYNKTKHGKYMYAIGGNQSAAEVSGINTKASLIKIYALAGALYGLAGILLAAKAGGATVNTGGGYELEAIAACTIGGVSTNGGVGRVSGILIGVLVFELLKSALQFLGVPTAFTYIVQGLVIIVAVALDLRKYLAKK